MAESIPRGPRIDDISDKDLALSNGDKIQDRLSSLLHSISSAIEEARNICDAYITQGLASRVWNSKSWEDKLAQCTKTFVRFRVELTLALSAHAARGVDDNSRQLRALQSRHFLLLRAYRRSWLIQISCPASTISEISSSSSLRLEK